MMEFPARLRRLREERRPVRSMAAVSELCGLERGAVGRYERGEPHRPGGLLRGQPGLLNGAVRVPLKKLGTQAEKPLWEAGSGAVPLWP